LLATLVALLLLSGDIQPNPGPPATATDYVTLGSLNIRSVTTKAALVHDIIQDNSIQILALQETWLPSDSHPAIKQDAAPPGFVVHHVHRPIVAGGPSRGGGLAVISSEHIKVRPRDLHFTPSTFELQSVSVHTSPPVLLLNIYQPNSPPPSAFFAELDTLLTNIAAESSSPLVLCGDLNCPGANGQSVNDHLDDVLTSCGLHQFVKQPTRGPNLLDVVASSDPHLVPEVRVIDCCEVTDHRLVTAKIRARRPRPPPLEFTYRDLKRLNLADFEASIRRSELFTSPACTADLFAEQLRSVVTAVLDKFVPLKTVKKRAQKSSSKWLSTEAVSAKRDRRRLERIWHKSRSEPDRCAYRVACRRANRLINQSRSDFIRREIDSCVDLKQRWSTIKKLLHSKDSKELFDNIDIGLCDKFADFFASKIVQLRHNVLSRLASYLSTEPQPLPAEPVHTGPTLQTLPPVTTQEVAKVLSCLRPKSSALDYIPTSVIKSCPNVFSILIAKLANMSFQEGRFPQCFKTALVTPLIKKPNLDPSNLANFRPISNLNNISKILERLFMSRLQPHVLSCPNFNPLQSAYRRGHSTETALLCTLDHVFHSSDGGQSTLLVSLDLSAAFDTIDHATLTSRLQNTFGLSGPALSWIHSYLSSRCQVVKLGKHSSSPQACDSGVPQGSVLGPLLFTIYVSPIASLLSQLGVCQHQYADDTQLYIAISASSAAANLKVLESALSCLSFWFSQNYLALNPEKSDAILIGTEKRNRTLSGINTINVAGSTVPLAQSIKLLGVTLDKSLTFHKHVNLISQSCFYHIKALRHLRHTIDTHTASLIAHALVSSRLDYANSILYGAAKSTVAKLQRVQNTLSHIVLQANRQSHSSSLLHQLHWLPVQSRIHFKLATITYKALSTSSPQYLASLLHTYQPTRSLRSSNQNLLNVPAYHINFGSRSFRCAAPSIWNAIPLHIRSSPSLDLFKRNLKTYYFSHPPV
jgi:hypothetical protein